MEFLQPQLEAHYDHWHAEQSYTFDTFTFCFEGVLAICALFNARIREHSAVWYIVLMAACAEWIFLYVILSKWRDYSQYRGTFFIILHMLGGMSNALIPMKFGEFIREGKSDWQVFKVMLYARLPQYLPTAIFHRVKLSLAPLSLFLGILMCHTGSASAYMAELESNIYVVALTEKVNGALLAPLHLGDLLVPSPLWALLGQGLVVQASLLVPLLWIMLQAAGFWCVYLVSMKLERSSRHQFLGSRGLPRNVPSADPWDQIKVLAIFQLVFLFFLFQDFRIY
eukprot:jgi/Botrbrau1/1529/Bobra.0107s0017.1